MSTGCLASPYTFPGRAVVLLKRVDRLGGGLSEGSLLGLGRSGERRGKGGGTPRGGV